MNILREVRRASNKSMPIRILLLSTFCVIFVVTTYAWFSTQRNIELGGLKGYTTAWDVSYYVNSDENQILDETAVFTIDEMYPGMPNREDIVHVYNIGKASTNITYELISVKVFGQEVLTNDENGEQVLEVHKTDENGEEVIETVPVTINGKTTNVFSGDTEYPFNVSFTYDKNKLIGQYEEGGEYEASAHAVVRFNTSWAYEGTGTDVEKLARDVLDTKFGKAAYKYYQNNETTSAIEVKVKITSSMIHPKDDPDYPYNDYPYGQGE